MLALVLPVLSTPILFLHYLSIFPSLTPFPRLFHSLLSLTSFLSLTPHSLLSLSPSLSPSSQEEDTASRSDVEAHGNQYSSASSMFVFMKNSIKRCTALSNGQVSTVFVRVRTCVFICVEDHLLGPSQKKLLLLYF